MSKNNYKSELQKIQQQKINYFCEFINNNSLSQAEYYLNKANWDEKVAIELYYNNPDYQNNHKQNINNNKNKIDIPKRNNLKRHASAKTNHKNNQNNDFKNINIPPIGNVENKYLEYNIQMLLFKRENKGIHSVHDKTLLYIKNNLKNVETNFKTFFQKLVINAGIILIFKEENIDRLKYQIDLINEMNEIYHNYIIFPVSNNSVEGSEIKTRLSCISFPSYIFCKYKNDHKIYITDRMEGAFEKWFMSESIKKIISSLNYNMKENNDKLNNIALPKPKTNMKKKGNEQIFDNVFNHFNDNKRDIKKNEIDRKKNPKELMNQNKYKNINKDNGYGRKNEININNKENIIENNNKNINQINFWNNKNNFNNKIDFQKNIIDNNNKNKDAININIIKDDKNINKIKDDKNDNKIKDDKNNNNEFRYSNLGDFYLGDSMEIPNLFKFLNDNSINKKNDDINKEEQQKFDNNLYENINNNIYEDKKNKENIENNNINPNILNDNNMMLRDSIFNLSDGQVLAKREQEMRKLEKLQEEKEKKEEEEKRKKLEEEKKIKKYEKEAEIAKMILAPEPEENNPDVCFIKFRLPDGEKMKERRFLKTDKISVLYDYIKSIGREIFMEPDACDFDILYLGFPKKNLEDSKNSTLEKEGLYPNSILQISEK